MFCVRMRLLLTVAVFCIVDAASVRKRTGDSANQLEEVSKATKPHPTSTVTSPAPAIIAIEIVDAPANSTIKGKTTSKRTIESSLGYGYHNTHKTALPKKFVIYKYSQQDIVPSQYAHHENIHDNQIDFQNGPENHVSSTTTYGQSSVEEKLTRPHYGVPTNAYYNPGNTVYTTLNNQGQLGGLSNQVPYHNNGQNGAVPVILLRVYSNQLENPQAALHTNLPDAHPYSNLNNINLQSLLQNYVQQYLHSQQNYAPYEASNYQQYYHPQPNHHAEPETESNLPTSENYPSQQHTRVIFHSNNNGHIAVPKVMYRTPGLSTYQTAPVPSYASAPVNQYSYNYDTQQNQQQAYMYLYPVQIDQGAYYQQADDLYQQQQQQQQPQQYQVPEQHQAGIPAQSSNEQAAPEEHTNPPYNYHAHPQSSYKYRRSQPIEVSSTLPPKRREPRIKLS